MNTDQIKAVLDQLDAVGVSDLSITGGEPLLRNDALEILKYAAQKEGFKLILNTNGLLVTEKIIGFLEEHCPHILVAVSLDGYNGETYSHLRRSRSRPDEVLNREFNQVLVVLSKLAQSNLNIGVNYTVTRLTIDNFFPTYDLIRSLGVNNILAIKFFPYGAGRRYRDDLELSYDLWEKFMIEMTERKLKDPYYNGLQVSTTCPWEIYLPLLQNYKPEIIEQVWKYNSPLKSELYRRNRSLGCHAGVTNCAISANGDVYPCGTISAKFPPFVCGNLKTQSFTEIWRNSPMLRALRALDVNEIEGHCVQCTLKQLCGGGCRARAFAQYLDLRAPDYLCPLQEAYVKGGKRYANVGHQR